MAISVAILLLMPFKLAIVQWSTLCVLRDEIGFYMFYRDN